MLLEGAHKNKACQIYSRMASTMERPFEEIVALHRAPAPTESRPDLAAENSLTGLRVATESGPLEGANAMVRLNALAEQEMANLKMDQPAAWYRESVAQIASKTARAVADASKELWDMRFTDLNDLARNVNQSVTKDGRSVYLLIFLVLVVLIVKSLAVQAVKKKEDI